MVSSSPDLDGNFAPVTDETTITGLPVDGTLPASLDGQYLRLGPNPARRPDEPYAWRDTDTMVHAVELRHGRAVSYRNRWVLTPHVAGVLGLGPATTIVDSCERLVPAVRRLLAVARSGVAYEVDERLQTQRVTVDGDLADVIGADACLADAAADHAHHPLALDDRSARVLRADGNGLVVVRRGRTVVVDPTPQGWLTAGSASRGVRRVVCSVALGDRPFGETVVYRHDLARGTRVAFNAGVGRHPGELTFVPDDERPRDDGWLLGFVHDDGRGTDDLVVLDARRPDLGPVATVRLPRRVPFGWHGSWRPR